MHMLPKGVTLRFVAWEKNKTIRDVHDFDTREAYRKYARMYSGQNMRDCQVKVEVVSENARLVFTADLVKGIPAKCRTEQACMKVDDTLVSIDRFWDVLCESITEVLGQ